MCFPVNFPKSSWALFLQDISKRLARNVLYLLMLSICCLILSMCFHSFPCRFFTDIKNRFHYLKCFSQVAAKRIKNKLQVEKNNAICS